MIKVTNSNIVNVVNAICQEAQNDLVQTVKNIHLTLPYRLIHLILTYNITPKLASRDQINNLEVYLIWAIWTRKRLNWAGIIFYRFFKRGILRNNSNLEYGIALFKLFKNFEVDMEHEIDVHKLTKDDYFSKDIICKMYYDLVDDRWVKG